MQERKVCFYCKKYENPYNPHGPKENIHNFKIIELTKEQELLYKDYKIVDMHNECARIDELMIDIANIENEIDDIKHNRPKDEE
jgi:hypothetical protein